MKRRQVDPAGGRAFRRMVLFAWCSDHRLGKRASGHNQSVGWRADRRRRLCYRCSGREVDRAG